MASPKFKVRGIASKHPKFTGYEPANRPCVKIMKCISFQKFRYCGENRPGKKYQDKDFMQLALCHLSGKSVRVHIVCFDSERTNEIHPNGLVGRDCEHGVYTKQYFVSKNTQVIRIPYLRTERILTKKIKQEEGGPIKAVFSDRAKILPSPYRDQCLRQAEQVKKYDTTRVCFGVIATIEDLKVEPLFCLSNVVQNASEKTMLKILKLSTQYVSAQEGGDIDIFTSEDGPPIVAGKCSVKVVVSSPDGEVLWESEEATPADDQILYKRVVTYRVPAYQPNPATDCTVRGVVTLSCTQSGQFCTYDINYEPGADSARRFATRHSKMPLRKRPYVSPPEDENKYADDIKWRVKEKVKSRQSQAEPMYDLTKPEASTPPITTTTAPQPVAVSNGLNTLIPMAASEQDMIPLHQQDDIVLAKDLVTGQVVYIRTPQTQNTPSDLVMYVDDGQSDGSANGITLLSEASRALAPAATDWTEMATISTPSTSTTVLRTHEPVAAQVRRSASHQTPGVPARKKAKFVSPWIVAEPENTPLVNGDISFTQTKDPSPASGHAIAFRGAADLKSEPPDMGPPILTPAPNLHISSETVPGMSNNLPSGTFISSANLPSLGSLLTSGVLEGVKFDDTGTLLSSSVFEMVRPYM